METIQFEDVNFFPRSILNAIRCNDITALDAALDLFTPDNFLEHRKLMLPIDYYAKTPQWDHNTLECLTNPKPTSHTYFIIFIDIDLLILALHFVSTNIVFTQVVDQLLLWGICPNPNPSADSEVVVGNVTFPISLINRIDTFIKKANNPPNAHLVAQRQNEIAATLQSCRNTLLYSDIWDIIQSYLTPITFCSRTKRVKRE